MASGKNMARLQALLAEARAEQESARASLNPLAGLDIPRSPATWASSRDLPAPTQDDLDWRETFDLYEESERERLERPERSPLGPIIGRVIDPAVAIASDPQARQRLMSGETLDTFLGDIGLGDSGEGREGSPEFPLGEIGEAAGDTWRGVLGALERPSLSGQATGVAANVAAGGLRAADAIGDWWNDDDNEFSRPARMGRGFLEIHPGADDPITGYGADFAMAATGGPWTAAADAEQAANFERARIRAFSNNGEGPIAFDASALNRAVDDQSLNTGAAALTLGFGALDISDVARVGARASDALPATRVTDDAPMSFEGAPRPQGDVLDVEAMPAPSSRRSFFAAVRDPETGEVYRGADHLEAIGSAPDDVRDRLYSHYYSADKVEDPNIIGFEVNGQFMGREEGLTAMRAARERPLVARPVETASNGLRPLRTAEARDEWASEAIVREPPDAFSGADVYGFRGPSGAEVAVTIQPLGPSSPGEFAVSFEDLARTNAFDPHDAQGRFSPTEARQILNRVVATIEEDARSMGRGRYILTPASPQHAAVYQAMARNIEPPPGYRIQQHESGALHVIRQPDAPPPLSPRLETVGSEEFLPEAIRRMPLLEASIGAGAGAGLGALANESAEASDGEGGAEDWALPILGGAAGAYLMTRGRRAPTLSRGAPRVGDDLLEGADEIAPSAPDAGGAGQGQRFRLEGGDADSTRSYSVPIGDGRAVQMKVLRNGEIAWGIMSADGRGVSALPVAERSALGLRAIRGIHEALRHDAEQFGLTRYGFQGDAHRQPLYRMLAQDAGRYGFDFNEPRRGMFELTRRAPDAPDVGSWADVYTGQRGDPNRPWRGHLWTATNEAVAREYGPRVRHLQGNINGAPVVRVEADLRGLLGEQADQLMSDRQADVWAYLDKPAIRDALRERGIGVVRVPDDMAPNQPNASWHESYLFLDEGRIRAPNAPARSDGLIDLSPRDIEGLPNRNVPSPRFEPVNNARLTADESYVASRARAGLSPREIAEEMDTSSGSVRVLLHRVRTKAPDLEIGASQNGRPRGGDGVTQRVAELKAQGLSRAEIAERTGLTPEQVDTRLQSAAHLRRNGRLEGGAALAAGGAAGALAFGDEAWAEVQEALADGRDIEELPEGLDLRDGEWLDQSWTPVQLADGSEGIIRTIEYNGEMYTLVGRQNPDTSIDVLGSVRPAPLPELGRGEIVAPPNYVSTDSQGWDSEPYSARQSDDEEGTPAWARGLTALTTGVVTRGLARRFGARGALGEAVGAGAAAATDAGLGGDPSEILFAAGLTPLGGRGADLAIKTAGRTADDLNLELSPDFIARRDAFAETLSDSTPTTRGVEANSASVLDRRFLIPRDEMVEQGYATERPAMRNVEDSRQRLEPQPSPRQQFLELSAPDEQLRMMERAARGAWAPETPRIAQRPELSDVTRSYFREGTPDADRVARGMEVRRIVKDGEPQLIDLPEISFTEPATGRERSIFGEPRRERAPRPPLEERATEKGAAGALQGVTAPTLRRIANDLDIEADGVAAPALRKTLIRELGRQFDSTRELVAFLTRYGVSSALISAAALSEGANYDPALDLN